MKNVAYWISAGALTLLLGCGKNEIDTQARSHTGPQPKQQFGSATDISTNSQLPSNPQNAADNGLGGPVQRESGNYQKQPLTAQNTDDEMAKRIKVAITTGSTGTTGAIAADQLTPIDVQVHNGNVTLNGPVSSEGEKTTIARQVAGLPGVKSVQNNLTVGPSSHAEKPLQPLVPRGPGNE